MERRKMDEKENEIARKQRQEALERANKIMHDGQDQVKAFHSKMLLAEVLQERDMHDDLKKRKQKIEEQIEQQWVDQEKVTMQVYDQNTTKKLEQEYAKKMANAKVIKN
jgi:hypothetical protein